LSKFVYYIAALKHVFGRTLAETCFCQDGLNQFKLCFSV